MAFEWSATYIGWYVVLGFICGIFSATFGVGSGVIIVPTLTLLAAMPQKDAQGVSLAVMVPMALMGALRYHWNPAIHIDFRIVAVLSIFVVAGANVGATIAGYLSNQKLQLGFGIFLFVVGTRFILLGLKGAQ